MVPVYPGFEVRAFKTQCQKGMSYINIYLILIKNARTRYFIYLFIYALNDIKTRNSISIELLKKSIK